MSVLATANTAIITGLEPTTITVEVDLSRGKPQLIIIGLATQAVTESKERITSALLNCGIRPKAKRTVVNLAPADIKKTGTGFDLAISIAMLKAYRVINYNISETMFFGELSLDGSIKKIRGILPLILYAKQCGVQQVVIPTENQNEVSFIEGIKIFPVEHLNQLLKMKNFENLPFLIPKPVPYCSPQNFKVCFEDIYEQSEAKRALEVVAAGGHNILLTGPPGTGKSMLAQALVSILPPLQKSELIEVNSLYSVAGLLERDVITNRPFRSPHHTISSTAIVGGGAKIVPGEISLAHRGVLFLDEIPEFPKNILESLRQPLENGVISVSRIMGTVKFPCEFILVAANNPCPCGYKYSQQKLCTCSYVQYQNYEKKLSGPILDRIDIQLQINAVETKKISDQNLALNETSAITRERVIKARNIQLKRYKNENILTNSQLNTKQLRKYCSLNPQADLLLKRATQKYQFSTRTYFRLIKVARTIADLAGNIAISQNDITQALQYRKKDR